MHQYRFPVEAVKFNQNANMFSHPHPKTQSVHTKHQIDIPKKTQVDLTVAIGSIEIPKQI